MVRPWGVKIAAAAAVAWLCAALGAPALANVEELSPREVQLQGRLLDLWWASPLSAEQAATAIDALGSPKSAVVIEALRLVAIHELVAALPKVRDLAAHHPFAAEKALATAVAEALTADAGVESSLRSRLAAPLEGDDYWRGAEGHMKPFGYVRGMLSQCLAVREARRLRAGEVVDADVLSVDGLDVEGFERQLISFSRVSEGEAVREILARVQRAEVLSSHEYDLVAVLRTYRGTARGEILRRLDTPAQVRAMSGYGKTVLLGFLQDELPHLTTAEVSRLRAVVTRMKADAFAPLSRKATTLERLIPKGQR